MSRFPWALLSLVLLVVILKADDPAPKFQGPRNSEADSLLESAERFVKQENWTKAIDAFQAMLDLDQDAFVEVKRTTPDGKTETVPVLLWGEANRRLGQLPDAARKMYQEKYDLAAKELLSVARRKNDVELMAESARRFLWTESGRDALETIFRLQANNRFFASADVALRDLLQRSQAEQLTAESLFWAAALRKRAGDEDGFNNYWKVLSQKARDGLLFQGTKRSLEYLRLEAEQRAKDRLWESDYPILRGNLSRSGPTMGRTPFLVDRWHLSTLKQTTTKDVVRNAVADWENRGGIALPASVPIFADSKLVFRSSDGLYAVDATTGDVRWHTGENAKWSFDRITSEGQKWSTVKGWYQHFSSTGRPDLIYSNSTIGTLSADDQCVYAIDDLPFPVPNLPPKQDRLYFGGPALEEAVKGSRLQAYQIKSGKLLWEIGVKDPRENKPDLSEMFFTGSPLPINGVLYVLAEKKQQLRLLALETKRGDLLWTHPLGKPPTGMMFDSERRIEAAPLAFSEGVLVCPTNAGAVVAVDVLTRRTLWTFLYGDGPKPGWKASTVMVRDGRVLIAPPDHPELICVRLLDGQVLWRMPMAKADLFIGGLFGDRIVIVSGKECRAVNAKDGKELWKVATGTPSGQGAGGRDTYYLPLKSPVGGGDPEVCVLDLVKGTIQEHLPSPKKEALGNLVFTNRQLFAQSLTSVRAFPLLDDLKYLLEEKLKKNPKDPEALLDRAELHAYRGDLAKAVEDLKAALAESPPEPIKTKARQRLLEVLSEWLQRDFDKAEKYLTEHRDLSKAALGNQLVIKHWLLVGAGREKQGQRLEAIKAFLEAGLLESKEELIDSPNDPKLKVNVLALVAGRIAALIEKADANERKDIDKELQRRWKELKDGNDNNKMMRFQQIMGPGFTKSGESPFTVADALIDLGSFREAELLLLALRRQETDVKLAALAAEKLALLSLKEERPEEAMFWYRELDRVFRTVVVRDGLTGTDLYQTVTTNKRLLPFLVSDSPARVRFKPEYGDFARRFNQIPVVFHDEGGPLADRYQLQVNPTSGMLTTTERQRDWIWQEKLLQDGPWGKGEGPRWSAAQFMAKSLGRLLVLHTGDQVYGLEAGNRGIMWRAPTLSKQPKAGSVLFAPPGTKDGLITLSFADGAEVQVGTPLVMTTRAICFPTDEGLVAVDPMTGRLLWRHEGAFTDAEFVGSERHIIALHPGEDGKPSRLRAFRTLDGFEETLPDAKPSGDRLGWVGENLLLFEADREGKSLVRLFDIVSGKDRWSRAYTALSMPLQAGASRATGVIEPDGRVTILDGQSGEEQGDFRIEPEFLKKAQTAYLLRDQRNWYVVLNRARPLENPMKEPEPWAGTRTLPVNGWIFTYQIGKGWLYRVEITGQWIVLDHFYDLPFILCVCRTEKLMGLAMQPWIAQVVALKAFGKGTGKLIMDEPEMAPNAEMPKFQLHYDRLHQKLELTNPKARLTFTMEPRMPPK